MLVDALREKIRGEENPYQSVNVNQDADLGVLRRQRVTVDGHSPPLVHTHLGLARHAIDHGSQLGAEQEDVDTAEARDFVEGFGDGLSQLASLEVADEVAVDVDGGAALCKRVSMYTSSNEPHGFERAVKRTMEMGVSLKMASRLL